MDNLPPVAMYKEYLRKVCLEFGCSIDTARKLIGGKTIKEIELLLKAFK